MQYARVLLISITARWGRQFVHGLNALGVPLVSSRMSALHPLVLLLLVRYGSLLPRKDPYDTAGAEVVDMPHHGLTRPRSLGIFVS